MSEYCQKDIYRWELENKKIQLYWRILARIPAHNLVSQGWWKRMCRLWLATWSPAPVSHGSKRHANCSQRKFMARHHDSKEVERKSPIEAVFKSFLGAHEHTTTLIDFHEQTNFSNIRNVRLQKKTRHSIYSWDFTTHPQGRDRNTQSFRAKLIPDFHINQGRQHDFKSQIRGERKLLWYMRYNVVMSLYYRFLYFQMPVTTYN